MAGKLTVKIPPTPFVRVSSRDEEPRQRPVMRSLKPKPGQGCSSSSSQPHRLLRDPTDYESDCSQYSESDDEDEDLCDGRTGAVLLPRHMRKEKAASNRRRGSAANGHDHEHGREDEDEEQDHSMLPSPGEYEALVASENNPFAPDSGLPVSTPAGLGGKFSHAKPKSSYSISSCSSSSSLISQASGSSSCSIVSASSSSMPVPAPTSRNRWAGFWGGGRRSPSPSSGPPAKEDAQKTVETEIEVKVVRPKWEITTEETLLILRRQEEAAERALEEEKRKALERLQSLGITDSGARCIDRD
ncbi:hypothetical protein G7054_g7252 [Neopestalotiopsis clavispora]|nr:hypothetical protein G7054_g7252 [Neopestalotiopsis clavispora]